MKFKQFLHFLITLNLVITGVLASERECKKLLLSEFKNVISKDDGLIQAQLSFTAMKLAKKVLNRNGLGSQTIEAYTQSIVGNKTISRLESNSQIQNEILDLYSSYSGDKKYLNAKADLEDLTKKERMSDEDVSKLMIQLEGSWKNFGFDKKDYAMSWFINTASKNATGKESYLISDAVKKILSSGNVEVKIARNFKEAQLKIKSQIARIKARVFEKHKSKCLDHFNDNISAQNTSIFENISCSISENEILDGLFIKSLEDLLSNSEVGNTVNPLHISNVNTPLSSKEKRRIQDNINELSDNKKKIIEYYKQGLATTNCEGFLIIDKKNNSTSLHLNNGDEVMTSKSILGTGKMNEFKEFNPDSILRKWKVKNSDGSIIMRNEKPVYKYTRTTGAGVFYMDKTLTPEDRKSRKYDQEFNDRVMVIYSKKENGNREEVQAIHGVPNIGWINNRDSRMKSFDDKKASMKLSTGCVNLEGYTYDIMDEFIGNNCPMYVLPEDKDNYYNIKNGEVVFTTDNSLRKSQKEHSNMVLSSGEKVKDPNNYNQYNYNPKNRNNHVKGYLLADGTKSKVLSKLLAEKETLYRRAAVIENDDFEDLVELTFAITKDEEKAVDVFIDLYKAFYRSSPINSLKKYQKKIMILKRYQEDFNSNLDINSTMTKSEDVILKYE